MDHPAVIRLLFEGLAGDAGQPPLAAPFPLEELASSPLAPPACMDGGWTLREGAGLRWLERLAPALHAPLYLTGPCTSTLDTAKRLGELGLFPEWASVLALSQTAGRGQMRRGWASPEGNVYAAMRLPLEGPFQTFAAAPAIGGLLAEALHAEGCPVLLKWPNDLLLPAEGFVQSELPGREGCHKVGGILLEERKGKLTAGIGLNTDSCPPLATLRDNTVFSAGILRDRNGIPLCSNHGGSPGNALANVTIFTLWERLAGSIVSCYVIDSTSSSWWPSLAQRHLAFRGCRIALADACPEDDTMARFPCEGIVDGVTPSGALRLRTEYGMETFLGGSLLPRS